MMPLWKAGSTVSEMNDSMEAWSVIQASFAVFR
jgi:hypothetical protein